MVFLIKLLDLTKLTVGNIIMVINHRGIVCGILAIFNRFLSWLARRFGRFYRYLVGLMWLIFRIRWVFSWGIHWHWISAHFRRWLSWLSLWWAILLKLAVFAVVVGIELDWKYLSLSMSLLWSEYLFVILISALMASYYCIDEGCMNLSYYYTPSHQAMLCRSCPAWWIGWEFIIVMVGWWFEGVVWWGRVRQMLVRLVFGIGVAGVVADMLSWVFVGRICFRWRWWVII